MKEAWKPHLGYAHVELHLKERCGFPEFIFSVRAKPRNGSRRRSPVVDSGQPPRALATTPLMQSKQLILAQRFSAKPRSIASDGTFWLPSGPPAHRKAVWSSSRPARATYPFAPPTGTAPLVIGCGALPRCEVSMSVDVGVAGKSITDS